MCEWDMLWWAFRRGLLIHLHQCDGTSTCEDLWRTGAGRDGRPQQLKVSGWL